MREKKSKIPLGGIAQDASQRALAELLKAKGFAETISPTAGLSPSLSREADFDLSNAGKIVLRRERKGRGGKTVTLVTGLTLSAPRLELLARALRKSLGCGSTVEQGAIVLQGDIIVRAQQWLLKHGAT
jgi:translation initiation factor 1